MRSLRHDSGFHELTRSGPSVITNREVRVAQQHDPSAAILDLQRQAGNQAVSAAVQRILHGGMIQAKMAVSNPGDPEEQEADRVADQVMRMHAGAPGKSPCACTEGGEICEECRQQQGTIARQSEGAHRPTASTGMLRGVLHLEGRSLDSATRVSSPPEYGRV